MTSYDYRAYDTPEGLHVSALSNTPEDKPSSTLSDTSSHIMRSEANSKCDQGVQENCSVESVFEQIKPSDAKRAPKTLSYCLFSALYTPHVGGVEAYTAGLAGELASRGHTVTIVTNQLSSHDPTRETQADGVEVIRLPCHPLLDGRLPLPHRNNAYQRTFDDLSNREFDRVVVNTRFYSLSLEGARFAQRIGAPALIIEHGSAHLSLGNPLLDKLVETYEHRATERLKACGFSFCAVSRAAEEWLGHFDISGVGVVSNALDMEAFKASASQRDFRRELRCDKSGFLVAFVGRLVPEKGVEALLQAARILSDITSLSDDEQTGSKQDTNPVKQYPNRLEEDPTDNSKGETTVLTNACSSTHPCPSPKPHITFAFAGEGPLLSAVQQTKCAHALGRLCSKDVAALLSSADVVCLPSRSEGFATTLLEAAAMSTAPVVTQVGGVEELAIASGCGYVLPNTKPTTIAATLSQAYDNRADCKARGARLHERAIRQISWTHSANTLEALFDDYNTRPSLETRQSTLKDSSQ